MAFILVPHLDPGHASMMTELLRRVTKLKVDEAKDGMEVQPNPVYVIAPNKDMSIYHGTINLETLKKTHALPDRKRNFSRKRFAVGPYFGDTSIH